MRNRMLILASLMLAGTLTITATAKAGHDVERSRNVRQQELTRTRISGTIESIRGSEATIITEDGGYYGVAMGPRDYWGRRGARFTSGSRVTIDAWGDPYGRTDWYFAGAVWGPGFYIELTNDHGVPHWVDYACGPNWCPTYSVYTDWYDCRPVVYSYALPPPPPVRYYHWYPRGYYPTQHRHYYRSYDFSRHDHGGSYDRGGRHHDGHGDWDRDRDRDHDRKGKGKGNRGRGNGRGRWDGPRGR